MTDRKGRKGRKPQAIGSVLKEMLEKSGMGDRLAQAQVIPEWDALVGPQIAEATAPLTVTAQGTLFVAVKSNAWMNELSLMEPQLLARLNEKTGRLKIRKIRWQIQR